MQNQKESNYIFPKFIAGAMSKVDQRTQYEASMLSMFFIMIGMALSVVYLFVYMDLKMWFKIVTLVNCFFGIMFMMSYLITTFQQYRSYMEFKSLQQAIPSLNSSARAKE